MAVHTKHPASEPPSAPVREKTRHLLLRGWCIFVLFTAFASPGWNNLLGTVGFAVLLGAIAVGSIAIWVPVLVRARRARAFPWVRLPWFLVGYVGWALVSVTWSAWPDATLATWAVLALTTGLGLFIAHVLTWRETVAAIASALKWLLGLSIVFELWVGLFLGGPLLPNFVDVPDAAPDAQWYWSRGNLFEGGRIQGLVGNANLLAMAALMAMIVFAIRFAARAPRRVTLVLWGALAAYLFVRASSATAWLALAAVIVVLATVLLMRTASRPRARTKYYIAYAVIGVGGALTLWFGRDALFGILGRSSDLTGRELIWSTVLEKAAQHPVVGWGFSTPWLPWEPAFDGWILDHGITVFMAHSMWIDAYFQLGAVGLALLALGVLAFVWRAWFFAVDRPRWDLRADRPYSPLTLLPTLVATVLLVQGVAESRPLMEWGWLLLTLLAFKIGQSPHVGVGPAERSAAIERGEPTGQTA